MKVLRFPNYCLLSIRFIFRRPARATAYLTTVFCLFIFQSSFFNSVSAQQPWNYSSIREAHLDDAYLVEPPAILKEKMKSTDLEYNRSYRLSVDSRKGARNSVRFQTDSIDFAVSEQLFNELQPYLVSHRYWKLRYKTLQQWAFVSLDAYQLISVDTSDHRYGPYSPVTWLGYHFQPSAEWPVVFLVRTNNHEVQHLTLPALQRLAEWGAFTTDAGQRNYEQNLVAIRQSQLSKQDSLQRHLDSLDRMSEHFGRQADSITVAMQRDSALLAEEQLMAQVQATKEKMNREKIFLLSLKTAKSDYMFGLEFNFYNCFDKTITKVEITVTPVNANGQIQKDQFNRDVRTVRCMGPIREGSPAQYTFDELFWDDRGRIKFMRVSSITFHFTDGTHRTFSGYQNILKHTLNP